MPDDQEPGTITGYKGASTIRAFATHANPTAHQPLIALVTEEILWAGGSRHGRVDLTPEAARDLRDQLTQLLHDHYLGAE